MRLFGLGTAVLISAVLLVFVWVVGRAFGFEISLGASLGLTVLLTIVLNLVVGGLARRRRRWT